MVKQMGKSNPRPVLHVHCLGHRR